MCYYVRDVDKLYVREGKWFIIGSIIGDVGVRVLIILRAFVLVI